MRVINYLVFGIILLASCRNETKQARQDNADTAVAENPAAISSPPYSVEFDTNTQAINLQRSNESLEGVGANDIIGALNKKYKGIKLDLVKSGSDTIAVKIDNATTLTQEMGSTGAEAYLAELTFSLTELPGVKAVKIDFEEGDHAMPGVYTRNDFKGLIKPVK